MYVYLLIALGGALGGIARFWLAGFIGRHTGESLPWGTLAVNVSGAFLVGLLWASAGDALAWRYLAYGLLGSYTTVSAFSLQTLELARDGRPAAALGNVALSLAACFVAVAAGAGLAG